MNDVPSAGTYTVSFVIVARNSATYVPMLIADVCAQDYPHELMEVLFVDGHSSDQTRQIATKLLRESGLAYKLLDNPRRILATGWNIALEAAHGEIIVRVDAHARIASDFISNNVRAHDHGEFISGGPVLSAAESETVDVFLAVEQSRFGAGAANFRNTSKTPFYADTVGFGAYRRNVFAEVGGFHEFLVRHQDNEIHDRMRRAAYRFHFDPSIRSTRFVRKGAKAFLRQKFVTGYWIPLAASIQPTCFALRHFMPVAFFGLLLICGFASLKLHNWQLLATVLVPYFSLSFLFAYRAYQAHESMHISQALLLPVIFFATHLTYGLGTLVGIARMPTFWFAHRRYKIPRPLDSAIGITPTGCRERENGEGD